MAARLPARPLGTTALAAHATAGFQHEPVLVADVVRLASSAFAGAPTAWIVDCTVGGGGHADALLRALPEAQLLGLDRDPDAVAAARARLASHGTRARVAHTVFSSVAAATVQHGVGAVRFVLADLGVSSHQFDTPSRGFSLRFDGPLDMRMDPTQGESLAERLDSVTVEELADVLYAYGDIRRSIGTARIVLESVRGGATTTAALAALLERRLDRAGRIHPATQVFQALRMWVNDEEGELDGWLRSARALVDVDGGVLAVISFHSGEDRAVKYAVAEWERGGQWERVERKPIVASAAEQERNPRARSAKLRAVRRRADRVEAS